MADDESMREDLERGLAQAYGPESDASILMTLSALSGQEFQLPSAEIGAGLQRARYEVLGEIARGGMGVVMRSHDVDLGRDVAMKVLRPELSREPEVLSRFVEEAQIGGQLQHPGIVPVYEMGIREEQQAYFTMKLIKGRTLKELLTRRESLRSDRRRFLTTFEAICQTIAYAHSRGVIHRDIKPANVMVGSFGEVQVVDWGFAKVVEAPAKPRPISEDDDPPVHTVRSGSSHDHSQVGSAMGTPAYMPPEQAYGDGEHTDERSDVFALGATLCETLTGHPPYLKEDGNQLVQAAQLKTGPAFARLEACGADQELIELCKACLAPHEGRPRDAAAVAQAVSDYLTSVEERAHRAELRAAEEQVKAQEERKRRKLTGLLAAAALLIVVGGGGTYALVRQDALERTQANTLAVTSDLREAATLEAKARSTAALADWEQAGLAARQAAERAGVGDIDADVRTDATEVLARVEAAQAAAREAAAQRAKDEAMKARLEGISEQLGHAFHLLQMDRDYLAAFRDYGIDPTQGTPRHVADRIRASAIAQEFCGAFDAWAFALQVTGTQGDERVRRMLTIASLADPDPWRVAVRRAGADRDAPTLTKLRDEAKLADLDVASIHVLERGLAATLNPDAVIEFLRKAQAFHPGEYSINLRLGAMLHGKGKATARDAVAYLRAALAARPGDVEARHHLGLAHQVLGQHEEALVVWEQALLMKPDYHHLHIHTLQSEMDLGHHDEALARTLREIEANPSDGHAHWRLAIVHRIAERADEAIDALKDATRLAPDFGAAWYGLAYNYFRTGRPEQAVAHFEKANELDPHVGMPFFYKGQALEELKEFERAAEAYEQAIRAAPDYPHFRMAAATLLARMHRPDEAMRHHAAMVELFGDRKAVLDTESRLAGTFHVEGYDREARKVALRALPGLLRRAADETEPKPALLQLQLGGLLCDSLWRFDEAVEAFQRAIAINPRVIGAYWGTHVAQSKNGNLVAALESLKRMASRWPARHAMQLKMGQLEQQLGRVAEARPYLETAERLRDTNPWLSAQLRAVYLHVGEYDKALRQHERWYELVGDDWAPNLRPTPEAWTHHGKRLVELARRRKAILAGEDELTGARDLLLFGMMLHYEWDANAALPFYSKGLAADPSLADEMAPSPLHWTWRLMAADAAGEAGCATGPRGEAIGKEKQRALRGEALVALRECLQRMGQRLAGADVATRAELAYALTYLHTNLQHLRYGRLLASLPDQERGAWRGFWQEVDRLLRLARKN